MYPGAQGGGGGGGKGGMIRLRQCGSKVALISTQMWKIFKLHTLCAQEAFFVALSSYVQHALITALIAIGRAPFANRIQTY